MFSYNIFEHDSEVMLAICDDDILGKTFGDEVQITVSEFYTGKKCDDKKAVKLAKGATIINVVGNKITKLLIEKNIVESSSVMKIDGVMHAQVVSMRRLS